MSGRVLALWGALLVVLAGILAALVWRGPGARLGLGGDLRGGVVAPPADLADYGTVPDFALVAQTGDTTRLADLRGHVWIGDFIFTNCASSCPMMTARLKDLEAALGDVAGLRLVSFSVDPERDTPAKLAEYAAGYGADPARWLFLTGDKAAMRDLAVAGFHLPMDASTPEEIAQGAEAVLHSTRFVLVDAQARIRGYYDGTDAGAVERLGADVRRLAAGAVP